MQSARWGCSVCPGLGGSSPVHLRGDLQKQGQVRSSRGLVQGEQCPVHPALRVRFVANSFRPSPDTQPMTAHWTTPSRLGWKGPSVAPFLGPDPSFILFLQPHFLFLSPPSLPWPPSPSLFIPPPTLSQTPAHGSQLDSYFSTHLGSGSDSLPFSAPSPSCHSWPFQAHDPIMQAHPE